MYGVQSVDGGAFLCDLCRKRKALLAIVGKDDYWVICMWCYITGNETPQELALACRRAQEAENKEYLNG